MCNILLDNIPLFGIVEFFSFHKILSDNDLEVISLAPSEYLKRKFLLVYLQHFKLTVWPMILDLLHRNTRSMRLIGDQLMNGKVF